MAKKNKPASDIDQLDTNLLSQPVNEDDHVLGNPDAPITLVEYGSYLSIANDAAHEVVSGLRDQFGDDLRYVFRHFPLPENAPAMQAALLAEYADEVSGNFWEVHNALMDRRPMNEADFEQVTKDFNLPVPYTSGGAHAETATHRVENHVKSAYESGALLAPSFYINGRLY